MKVIAKAKDPLGYDVELVELDYPCPNCGYPHAIAMSVSEGPDLYVAWCPCSCFWRKDEKEVISAGHRPSIPNWWIK